MKKIMMLICTLGGIFLWSKDARAQDCGRNYRMMTGLSISSALRGCSEITIEHSISRHWSISASAGFDVGSIMKERSIEDRNHHQEFSSTAAEQKRSDGMHRGSVGFTFWTDRTFAGPFLTVEGEYIELRGADISCSFGYCIPVYCGLSITAGCEIRLTDIKERELNTDNLKLTLNYRF